MPCSGPRPTCLAQFTPPASLPPVPPLPPPPSPGIQAPQQLPTFLSLLHRCFFSAPFTHTRPQPCRPPAWPRFGGGGGSSSFTCSWQEQGGSGGRTGLLYSSLAVGGDLPSCCSCSWSPLPAPLRPPPARSEPLATLFPPTPFLATAPAPPPSAPAPVTNRRLVANTPLTLPAYRPASQHQQPPLRLSSSPPPTPACMERENGGERERSHVPDRILPVLGAALRLAPQFQVLEFPPPSQPPLGEPLGKEML